MKMINLTLKLKHHSMVFFYFFVLINFQLFSQQKENLGKFYGKAQVKSINENFERTFYVFNGVVKPGGENLNSGIISPLESVINDGSNAILPIAENTMQYTANLLSLETGERITFLKFVATNANESISTATLDLIIDNNSGNGTLEIYQANDKDLVKTNLNQSSQLKKHKIVGAISSVFNKGNRVSINLSDLNNESMITLIIKQKSGKDISFTSNESDANSPKLNLTYTEPVSKVTKLDLNNDISVYPNPTVDTVTLSSKALSSLASVKVYDINGVLLQVIPTVNKLEKIEIDFRAYGKGVYLINLQSLDNKFRLLKVIKE